MSTRPIRLRPLAIREILSWATAYHQNTGEWPTNAIEGGIAAAPWETWKGVDAALRQGLRGLPGGSSLARLLAEHCAVRNIHGLPPLTEEQILVWADDYHRRTGKWPSGSTGTIPDSGGEKWKNIDSALSHGVRGLPGGSSLARLLAQRRGARNRKQLPRLTEGQILLWADAHHQRTGRWPSRDSGPVADVSGETWLAADMALRKGRRGLPGGSSLPLLLAERRGVRNARSLPALAVEQILAWADAVHARTERWPHLDSGPIPGAQGATWNAINQALRRGSRGLPGGCTLAELLARERGVRNLVSVPGLTRKQILSWADAHHRRTEQWPTKGSGPVEGVPGETWAAVDAALQQGGRGLRGGSSLARLLAQHRGRRNHVDLPPLSLRKILAWADAYFERTGAWPNINSDEVPGEPGESWRRIDDALRQGHRGLKGKSSLLRLLVKKRGVRDPRNLPPLTEGRIRRWAERHRERGGECPKFNSGKIADAPGESWAGVDYALRHGKRGLPGGSSLAKLLSENQRAGRSVASRSDDGPPGSTSS